MKRKSKRFRWFFKVIKFDKAFCTSISKDVLGLGVETESILFLQPGRETKQVVKYLFTGMEDEILDLRANPIKTTILNKQVEIRVDVEPSQFDNSTLFHICGVDGAFCKVV